MRIRKTLIVPTMAVALAVSACASTNDAGSEDFWSELLVNASEVEQFGSVVDLAQGADLVVVGSISDVGVGRTWGSEDPTDRLTAVVLHLKVDEVLQGSLPPRTDGFVSVEREVMTVERRTEIRVDGDNLQFSDREPVATPGERAVWFLRVRNDAGTEIVPAETSYAGDISFRLVNSSSVVVDGRDGVELPLSAASISEHDHSGLPEDALAAELRALDFESLMELVRDS